MINKIKLTKWDISTDKDGIRIYSKKDMEGNPIITVRVQYDNFDDKMNYAIFYHPGAKYDWGAFVADAISEKDLAFDVVRWWLDFKGYDYGE